MQIRVLAGLLTIPQLRLRLVSEVALRAALCSQVELTTKDQRGTLDTPRRIRGRAKLSPADAKVYTKALLSLSKTAVDAEAAWRATETNAATIFGDEVLARTDLVRQLQRNEGALLSIFPGQRRRVRSFYRPTKCRGAAPDDGSPETEKLDG